MNANGYAGNAQPANNAGFPMANGVGRGGQLQYGGGGFGGGGNVGGGYGFQQGWAPGNGAPGGAVGYMQHANVPGNIMGGQAGMPPGGLGRGAGGNVVMGGVGQAGNAGGGVSHGMGWNGFPMGGGAAVVGAPPQAGGQPNVESSWAMPKNPMPMGGGGPQAGGYVIGGGANPHKAVPDNTEGADVESIRVANLEAMRGANLGFPRAGEKFEQQLFQNAEDQKQNSHGAGQEDIHGDGAGHEEDIHNTSAGHEDSQGAGHSDSAGHEDSHSDSARHEDNKGASHEDSHGDGVGREDSQVDSASHKESQSVGAGHEDSQSVGAGHEDSHGDDAGHKDSYVEGASHEKSQSNGVGHEDSQGDGAGHEDSHVDGAIHEKSQGDSAGHEDSQGDSAGHEDSHSDGAGHEKSQSVGAGQEDSPGDDAGHKDSYVEGAGHEKSQSDGVGHEDSMGDGAGHEKSHVDSAGHSASLEKSHGASQEDSQSVGAGHKDSHSDGRNRNMNEKTRSQEQINKLLTPQEKFEQHLFHNTNKIPKQNSHGDGQFQNAIIQKQKVEPQPLQQPKPHYLDYIDADLEGETDSQQQKKKQKKKQKQKQKQFQQQQQQLEDRRKQEIKEQFKQQQRQENLAKQKDKSTKKRQPSKVKEQNLFNLYDTRDSHPIIEYLPSQEDAESAMHTPSFVLEVTWPRVVQFYHPSSPRCQSLQSVYVAVARGIKRRSSRLPVEFHAVNCGMYRDVCEQGFNVKSVPTVLGLRSGRIDWSEIMLPGSIEGKKARSKEDFAKDVEQKVEYIASVLGFPLDVVKKGHAGAAFARPMGIDSEAEISPAIGAFAKGVTSYESTIPTADEVFHDARSSLLATLTSSLYSQSPHGSSLPHETSRTLAEFLDLIRWAFPPETQVHDLAEDLKREYFFVSTSEDGLLQVVGRHMDLGKGITWSSRCGAESTGGYSCGLWSLLHILSIGVVERHASVVGDAERVSVNNAGHVMRSFIEKFFIGCDSCRESWIELYDEACCGLHSADNSGGGKSDEWMNLSIWIWEVHNEVTIRRQQSAGKGYYRKQSRMASSSSLWPSKEDCSECWQALTDDTGLVMNMDSYNRKELYHHLKKTYWPSGVHNNRLIVLDRWSKARRALSMKRLRARMAAHNLSLFVLILHTAVACLIFRIVFPRWSRHIIKMAYLYCGRYRQVSSGKKRHKQKAHVERGHMNIYERPPRNSDNSRHHSSSRNHHSYPVRYKSSPASRPRPPQSLVPDRRNNRPGEYHHYPMQPSYESHYRLQEGRRRHSGSGSRPNEHQSNHFLV